ncbi:MAG: exonuclease subunit SbcD, partial [Chloroflexi bacterium]|nr:exonuclease subunit SbcD [Chloroflexota bacterium]
MRILHFADLHIGVENYGRIDPNTGLSTRLGDFLQTYDELVDYAIDTSVDLVLFCGDAYKSRDPSQTHQREFARRVARLSGAGIPTFLLVGNHDTPQVFAQATALEIFPTLNVANVHIGDRLRTYIVNTREGPLQIVALPWIKRSDFLASDAARGMTHQQINESIQTMIDNAIRVQVEGLDENVPAVLAGHVTVSQSTLASEQSMMLGHDHVLMNS